MDETMSLDKILNFLFTTLGVFALIFALAVLTPWMAKHVDKWIAKYRENHSPKRNELYSVRSIYELPPKKEPAPTEEPVSDEAAAQTESPKEQ